MMENRKNIILIQFSFTIYEDLLKLFNIFMLMLSLIIYLSDF